MNDPQNESGAYALNALGEAERREFETAMRESEQLRDEVTELTDTAVELGMSVPAIEPPAALRASILDAVARTPQLPPVEPRSATPRGAEPGPAELKARSRWSGSLVRIASVAAAVVLIAALGLTVRAGLQAQSDLTTASQINQIQAASDAAHQTVDISGGGTATVVWSLELRQAAVLIDGIKGLPAGSTYELWYMDAAGAATPAGTFEPAEDGRRSIVLAGTMDAGDTIGVTVEPAGGSPAPTGDPLFVVETA